jgi:heat shock protein HslJ
MRFKLSLALGTLLVLLLWTGACAKSACGDTEWQNVTWKLKSYGMPGNMAAMASNSDITLIFSSKDKNFNGTSLCNSYGGDYSINTGTCTLTLTNMFQTERACLDQSLMAQEQTYLNMIQNAGKIEVIGGELNITCGQKLLVFTR